MTWYDFVNFGLILVCILLILRRRSLPYEIFLLLSYFTLTFFIEVSSLYFILKMKLSNNLFLYHIFVPLQYLLICFYLIHLLKLNKKRTVFHLAFFSAGLMLFLSLYWNGLSQYFSFASIVNNLVICVLILLYFRKVFFDEVDTSQKNSEQIWICAGLFIKSLGNFFIEGSMNYLMTDTSLPIPFFYIHICLDFLFYTIFSIAFNKSRTQMD